ncbi:MAG TPA: histidine kinase [Candidatus Dormibacteraeota bacterium]
MRLSDRSLRWSGVALLAATLVVGIASAALSLIRGTSLLPKVAPTTLTDILAQGLPYTVIPLVGAFIVWRVPRNRVGWVLLAVSATFMIEQFATEYAYLALLRQPGRWPLGEFAAWVNFWMFAPGQWAVPLVLLLFPTGRSLSRGWRWVTRAALALALLNTIGWALLPTSAAPPGSTPPPFDNPLGQHFVATLAPVVFALSGPAIVIFAVLGLGSIAIRYRRADADGRHQLKWFLVSAPLLVISFAIGFFTPSSAGPVAVTPLAVIGTTVTIAGTVAVPLAIAIAIVKYRLYDIDIIISRTLVYGSLAALITGVYVGIAVGIGELVGSGGRPNLGLSILATAIVAIGFQPARERLQRIANRLVYGRRATPYQVLSEFSSQVAGSYAADEVLARMARVLQEGTGADVARVWLRRDTEMIAAAASPPDDATAPPVAVNNGTLPPLPTATRAVEVRHQGELLGALTVSKRRGESLSPVEEKLVDDLAHQAGLVLKNVGLTADLQRRLDELRASRQRLVSAQDEERRRLERNLHDGAQQHLVALKVKLGLAEMLAAKDPEKAKQTIVELKANTDEALETLRDLARGIYPPLLAEKGLVTALESQARKATLPVTVDAESIGRYPQEMEAAVYFCVLEALQNVQKYAGASAVTLRLREQDGELRFAVEDDGHGFEVDRVKKGAGLTNMHDRIDAAGGRLEISSEVGRGSRVAGALPVAAAATPRDSRVPAFT